MKRNTLIATILVLALILVGLAAVAVSLGSEPTDPTLQSTAGTAPSTTAPTTQPTTAPTTVPTEPPIVKVSTATVGATGDILMHAPVFNTGYQSATGTYNLDSIFAWFAPYVDSLDYAVANLEGTLAGGDYVYSDGYVGYRGYPGFNAPDAIAESLKDAGFDMLVTANNHSYDTRNKGFTRTQEVIASLGLAHTGTVASAEDDNYIVREINGINIGMICYTYNTGTKDDGSVSLNGIPLTVTDSGLINTFDYQYLDQFYTKLEGELAEMAAAGAEATVLFIHWGNEYQLSPNATQKAMAQQLCDLGIDVIIGGHPHVVQPMELLTSTADPEQKTVCLYSMGNAVSNQRLGLITSISTAHTEDGLLMSVRFAKYSDGTVVVEAVDILPTWVNMHTNDGPKVYQILPLDKSVSDWKTAFRLTDSQLQQSLASYDRTMALVGDGLTAVNDWCTRHQAEVEAILGVQ